MNIAKLIIISYFTILFIYGVVFEYTEANHSFQAGKPKDNESILSSIRKMEICMRYELRMVKWRRFFICSCIITLLIFSLIHQRFPSTKELLLYVAIIFIILIFNQVNYESRITNEVVSYNKQNISNLKKQLSETKSFIFPWNNK